MVRLIKTGIFQELLCSLSLIYHFYLFKIHTKLNFELNLSLTAMVDVAWTEACRKQLFV